MATEFADPDITLASTTESQAELDHATGTEWRKPFTPPAKTEGEGKPGEASAEKESKDATKTAAASEAAKAGAKEGKGEDDEPLPKGAQKRIDRLTAKLREAEEEAASLRKGKSSEAAKPAAAAANTDPEPQVKDFKTWDEWNAAHTRWAVRDENRKEAAKSAEKASADAAKETYDSHLSRINEFSTSHDDFEEVVREQPAFTFASDQANRAFQLAIVEADNGPEIMYHLAKNPEEMAKFTGLSPSKVQMMIGRLSAKLDDGSSDDSSGSAKPAPKAEEPKSKAPAPTTAVRRSAAAPATDMRDPNMSTDEWIRKRNEQERNRRRH